MPDTSLDAIVQRMIDAGESEENIATVIQGYAPATPPPGAATAGMMAPSTVNDPRYTPGIMDTGVAALQGVGDRVTEMGRGVASMPGILANTASEFAGDLTSGDLGRMGRAAMISPRMIGSAASGIAEGAMETGADLFSGDPRRMGQGSVDVAMMSPALGPAARLGARGARAGVGAADTAVRATGQFLEAHPAVSAGLGAAVGGMTGGVDGAIIGATGGGALPRAMRLLERLEPKPAAAQAPMPSHAPAPPVAFGGASNAAEQASLNRAVTDAMQAPTRPPPFTGVRNLEDIAIEANRRMRVARLAKEAQQGPAATQPVTPAAALEREVMARDTGGPINWRTTDAVPIDARKARGIIEPGESQIGLGERIAELLKAGTPEAMAEATQLAKALRQRGHVRMERAGS